MSRLSSLLVGLVACVLFGLSGGLIYASCATTECSLVTFKESDNGGCTEFYVAEGITLYSSHVTGGDEEEVLGTQKYRARGGCSSCDCSTTEHDEMCSNASSGDNNTWTNSMKRNGCSGLTPTP